MKKGLLSCICAITCLMAMAQWNANPSESMLAWPDGKSYYANEMQIGEDGTTWLCVYHPQNGTVATTIQAIDSTGVKLLGEEGLLVSEERNMTYTVVNQLIMVDKDGNAIVVVHDLRNSPSEEQRLSYTIYKVSPEGEMLWGNEGLSIDGGITYEMSAAMKVIQLEDGSYVFAWMRLNGNLFAIEMQRVSNDGELLWNADDVRLMDNTSTYTYPYLVNAGDNQFILVYAKGSNQDLYARKIDFDGTPVWPEDTRIYRGGFGSIPLWTILDVQPSGDGGVIVSWNDDRYYTNIESAYLSYVKPNGELGFTAGEEGQKLGYAGWRSFNVTARYDSKTNSFIALWRETDANQNWYRLVTQRVSLQGELLWGEEGLELCPMDTQPIAYMDLQPGGEGEMGVFYMMNHSYGFGDVTCYAMLLNSETGESVWEEQPFAFTENVSEKASLEVTPMAQGDYWIAKWEDNGVLGSDNNVDRLYMQRINRNMTLGNPEPGAVKATRTEMSQFRAISTIVNDEAIFQVVNTKEQPVSISIYDMQGKLVTTAYNGVMPQGSNYVTWNASSCNLSKGIYLATLASQEGTATVKIIIN